LGIVVSCNAIGLGQQEDDDSDGYGFNSLGRGILTIIGSDLPLDAEIDVAMDIFSDIRGPHPGQRLSDRTQFVLHCSSSDGVVAGGRLSISVLFSKDLADWDRVVPAYEERIDVAVKTKLVP
jgi:hypothetical protein